MATVAIDPPLPQAFKSESAQSITVTMLILKMGKPTTMPAVMDAIALGRTVPLVTHTYIPGASHFSFMDECSLIGHITIGLATPDAICAGLPGSMAPHPEITPKIISFLTPKLRS